MARQVYEKITENGIQNTHFFNGRLLAAEDMQVEQRAQRQRDGLLGQAIGPGIVSGLDVSVVDLNTGGIARTMQVEAGVAINANGGVIRLPAAEQIDLVGDPNAAETTAGAFGQCGPGTPTSTNTGIYLLVLSPASDLQGNAPLSGLGQNGKITDCGKRYEMEGVQLRTIRVNLDESLGLDTATITRLKLLVDGTNLQPSIQPGANDPASLSMLRSLVASLFLGASTAAGFPRDPQQLVRWQKSMLSAYQKYGLIDRLMDKQSKLFSRDDVPLALFYWTLRGVRFIDNWSGRRRTAQEYNSGPWGYVLGDRRTREGEAMILQFDKQMWALLNGQQGFPKVGSGALQANKFFAYLPPAGLLSVDGTGSAPGINPAIFFTGMKIRDLKKDPLFIEGAGLDSLLREATVYPPVETTSQELVWVYHVRENQMAIDLDPLNKPGQFLAYANGNISYKGYPRYDTNHWAYANFF